MKVYHNSIHTTRLLSAVAQNIYIKRHLITFRKFRQLYRQFWFPPPSSAPYNHICQIGDPVLRCKAELVNVEDIKKKEIQMVLKKMREVMRKYGSVGISAPQIGVPLRIFAVEFTKKLANEYSPEILKVRQMSVIPFKIFINPELKVIDYERVQFPEACESVRGFSADVLRYREVLVNGLDADGKRITWQVAGWPARIVQHEMDHLSGRLYTDIMGQQCTCAL